ncbi:putative S-adenosylmethionine-dependent methyltransferase/MSMEI_2290 [Methanoculleus chikugoensis]|uniref:Putative S-adenosylmethionine-dependent methyltransferase/MSMEI_2290 n=1 Tax=Methanoculleus chikugoensis TaxID=118126 RepID=A0A1M4MIA3_9EURY|nr:class I SAM-dependent methyltransferase [Methanoculleus chikugoensis]SCL74661.1 putative S-adenosylmethionine-dependent methyltransferase/MSMEI_2290 [Methanoculleus chikugoensis]
MSDTPFEIKDDEINVEEIMEKIRENIRRRKEAGVYPPDPNPAPPQDPTGSNSEIARDLAYISGNWDIQNRSYFISSHRPVAGKVLVKGRELVHGEVRRYVDPVIWKQAEFNRATGRVLEEVAREVSGIESLREQIREDTTRQIQTTIGEVRSRLKERLREQKHEILGEISETEEQIRDEVTELAAQVKAEIAEEVREQIRAELTEFVPQLKAEIAREVEERLRAEVTAAVTQAKAEISEEVGAQVRAEVAKQVQSALLAMDTDIENRAWLAKVLEGRVLRGAPGEAELPDSPSAGTGLNYFVFEDHFRGSREDIKERQRAFVRYFEGCSNVLDIGCGRGEFLELMRDAGIGARGVDLDETMVEFCRSRGLAVELNDAVSYLEQLEDESLDGVFIDQVVEHLEPAYLVRLLELCYRKMKFGYHIVAETVNPLSFVSFANFYIDMTHVRPVHPETLKFLLGAVGFREAETRFSSPVPAEITLQKLIPTEVIDDERKAFIESYNRNIDSLNGLLYGAQDYAIIGKK